MSGDDAMPGLAMHVLRRLSELQETHGWVSDGSLSALSEAESIPLSALEAVASFHPRYRRTPPPRCSIAICRDAPCAIRGARALTESTRRRLASRIDVAVEEVSCLGRCDVAPVAVINDVPLAFATDARLEAMALGMAPIPSAEPVPTGRRFATDPYGPGERRYGVLERMLAGDRAAIDTIPSLLVASGLGGAAGADVATGRAWERVRNAPGQPKYVICNAHDSEPGAFKDRVILAELSHLVIEGMLIACRVIGATTAIVYLRPEYVPERIAIAHAIDEAERQGALAAAEVESLTIFTSPGGYILGEETALLEVLEGRRGVPRAGPPFPPTHGLYGRPTLQSDVETFAHVPRILSDGPKRWFARGRNGGAGLKFIALAGDVVKPGVYEVATGTTVRELIDVHGGGVPEGRELVGFLPGGASAALLPASKLDTPLSFDAVRAAGSSLGSGAVMALAKGRDVLAVAANAVRFFRNESCGVCVPCRVGSEKAVEILERALAGTSTQEEFQALPALHKTICGSSLCALGTVALVPAISVLDHFPERLKPKSRTDRQAPA